MTKGQGHKAQGKPKSQITLDGPNYQFYFQFHEKAHTPCYGRNGRFELRFASEATSSMPSHPHIYVTTDESVSESEVRILSGDLPEALGSDRLLDFNGTGVILRVRTTDYPLLPDTLPKVACVLQVHLCTPYYGKGYERGYWPEIAATLEFLRRRVRRAQVWYGPGGTEMVYEVTGAFLDGVWDYWAAHGGRPYYSGRRQAPS